MICYVYNIWVGLKYLYLVSKIDFTNKNQIYNENL